MLKCTEIRHKSFEAMINQVSVINREIENEPVKRKALGITVRNFKLILWSPPRPIKNLFSIKERAKESLILCSTCQVYVVLVKNEYSWLD